MGWELGVCVVGLERYALRDVCAPLFFLHVFMLQNRVDTNPPTPPGSPTPPPPMHNPKAKALRMRRDLQRKFLFTEPMIPRAGEKVTVYYNPDNTVLRGRPDIWVRGSWNRWDQGREWEPVLMQV